MNNVMMRNALSNVTADNVTGLLDDLLAPSLAPSNAPPTGRQWGFIQDSQTLVIVILVGVVCFLLTLLIAFMAPYFFGFPSADDRRLIDPPHERRQSVDPERVKRRYQTITNWLITKDVVEHDANHCDEYLKQMTICQPCAEESAASASFPVTEKEEKQGGEASEVEPPQKEPLDEDTTTMIDESVKTTNSTPDADYDHDFGDFQCRNDCHICMEEFEVGDKVSWSASDTCKHTYHFQCIKEWLLKKKDCPYCRQTMLPIDEAFTDMAQLVEAKKQKEELTYFCKKDGLIVMPSSTVVSLPTSTEATVDEEVGNSSFVTGIVVDDDVMDGQFDIEPPLGNDAIVEAPVIWDGESINDEDRDLEAGQDPDDNNV
jgi:hypothetical protein